MAGWQRRPLVDDREITVCTGPGGLQREPVELGKGSSLTLRARWLKTFKLLCWWVGRYARCTMLVCTAASSQPCQMEPVVLIVSPPWAPGEGEGHPQATSLGSLTF